MKDSTISKKFKPWRKGKSAKVKIEKGIPSSSANGSLKKQLRSKERFLSKLKDKDDEKAKEIKKKLTKEIDQINTEIKKKEDMLRQKKNASKYHQIKFFERQKLTRIERTVRKKLAEAKQAADFDDVNKYTKQLEQTCMDQLYVAYYPNDIKYIAIFTNGVRIQDVDEKIKQLRKEIKQSILSKLKNGEISEEKSWVNFDIIKAKDFELSLCEEPSIISSLMTPSNNSGAGKTESIRKRKKEDLETKNKVLKEETGRIVKQKVSKTKDVSDSDSSSDSKDSSSDSSDHLDPMKKIKSAASTKSGNKESKAESDSDSDSSVPSSSSSSSDDSDSSTSDNSDEDGVNDRKITFAKKQNDKIPVSNNDNQYENEDSDDDFLVDDTDVKDISQVFAKASKEAVLSTDLPNEQRKGDKSQGWKSQKRTTFDWKSRQRN